MSNYIMSHSEASSIVALDHSDDMCSFLAGFLGAVLWTSGDMSLGSQDDSEDTPMDANWSICEVCPDDQLKIADKIRPFYNEWNNLWFNADYPDESAGHTLALEMCGSGISFLDRTELGDDAQRLRDAVDKTFGHYNEFYCHGDSENEVAHIEIS